MKRRDRHVAAREVLRLVALDKFTLPQVASLAGVSISDVQRITGTKPTTKPKPTAKPKRIAKSEDAYRPFSSYPVEVQEAARALALDERRARWRAQTARKDKRIRERRCSWCGSKAHTFANCGGA